MTPLSQHPPLLLLLLPLVGMGMGCGGGKKPSPEVPSAVEERPAAPPTTASLPPPPPGVGRVPPPGLGALPVQGALCLEGEETFFSCAVPDSRIASLCGRLEGEGEGEGEEWLQFRLGRLDELEVRFPPGPEQSLSVFSYGASEGRVVVALSNGRTAYALEDGGGWSGLRVTAPSGTETWLACVEGAGRGGGQRLGELSSRLRELAAPLPARPAP